MKTKLLTLVAVGVTLTGCGAPDSASMAAATFGQEAAAAASALGVTDAPTAAPTAEPTPAPTPTPKPAKTFYNQQQLILSMQDAEASADTFDGAMPEDPASKVKFNVQGTEKLASDSSFVTDGKLSFSDLTHKLHFQGQMDDSSEFVSTYILYANLTGTLDDGNRFTLDLGQISASEVAYTFQVTEPGQDAPRYQYSGISKKGNLKVMRK
jgi:hypothetical protein